MLAKNLAVCNTVPWSNISVNNVHHGIGLDVNLERALWKEHHKLGTFENRDNSWNQYNEIQHMKLQRSETGNKTNTE